MKCLKNFNTIQIKKRWIPFFLLGIIIACNQLEEVDMTSRRTEFPSRTFNNAKIIFKDSGFIKIHLKSKLIEEYGMIDTPYTEFRQGLELKYFTKSIDSPGYLRADWAKFSDMKAWYEGRGNVVLINEVGDTLKTETLFWDRNLRKVFTNDTVYIISKLGDSLQSNNGLEAKDDLSEYTLYNNQGTKIYEEGDF